MLVVSKNWRYRLYVPNEPRTYYNNVLAVSKIWHYRLFVANEPREYSKQMLAVYKKLALINR